MSENICQKRGSNQGKTSKKTENTNKTVSPESLETNSTHSLQYEIATKKSKKRRAKSQKNDEPATTATDECNIVQEVVVDESRNIKIGDGFCQKNENEKSPKKKNRPLDVKKKGSPNTSSLENIPEDKFEDESFNDSQIIKEDVVTGEGNKKKLKKKRRLEDAKEKNELETSCPEKMIKNDECKMTVISRGSKEVDNDIPETKENEEKPKRRRRRRNTKNKSALESSSSGKLTNDSVDSIILESSSSGKLTKYSAESITKSISNHGNIPHTEDNKIPTNYNGESCSNTRKTEDIRATIKRKISADSDKNMNILRKAPSTVDFIDSKQAMETGNGGTVSGMSKRRKRNKNKSRNEEQSLEDNNVEGQASINDDCKIRENEEFEEPLLRKNESQLSNEIKEDFKQIPEDDKKIKRRRPKTSSSTSRSSINTDPNCTSHNQYQANKAIRPIDQTASIPGVEIDNNVKKATFNFASSSDVQEQCFKDRISTDNTKLYDKKEKSNSKTKKLVSVIDIAPSKQSDESNSSQAPKNDKIGKEQNVSKKEVTPDSKPDNEENYYPRTAFEKYVMNKNIGLTKVGIEKNSERESYEFDSRVTDDHELLLKKSGNNNIQQADSKNKKSKSKKKQNGNQLIVTTHTSQADKETVAGGKIRPVIEGKTEIEEITETLSKEKTENVSTVEVKNTKKLISVNDSKSKKRISYCSKSLNAFDNRELHGQENDNKNKRNNSKLKKEKQLDYKIDEEIDNSNKIAFTITNSIADNDKLFSLAGTASKSCHNHDGSGSIPNRRNSVPESHISEAVEDDTKFKTLQQFILFDLQKYDSFLMSESDKHFAKLLDSEYNASKINSTTKITTDSDNDSTDKYYTKTTTNEYYTETTESESDSSNDHYAKTTVPGIDSYNDYNTKYVGSDESIFDNYTHEPLIINHFEDRVEEIPEEVRASNPDLKRVSDNCSITGNSNCNEKQLNSNCTLPWSQVAAKEAKAKSEVSQYHAPENQQKNKQKLLESSKPVRIIVADRPSRGDNDIATVDDEGFVKYVSKREMRKQRSRTSSRNDEQEVAEALEEIQNETSTNKVKSSILSQTDNKVLICETVDESNSSKSMEAKTVKFLFETGIWMDKWKYHDAEVEFFESKEKITETLLSAILQTSAGDNDDDHQLTSASDIDDDGDTSASEPASPTKAKRRRSRRKRRNKNKESCSKISNGEDDTYNSDEDPINFNSHMDSTPGTSSGVTKQDNSHRIENDTTNDDADSLICNANPNSSQKIKQLFVMILMELYFMLIYYASGMKKNKKVE